VGAAGAVSASSGAPVNCDVSPEAQVVSTEEQQFLDLLNEYRASAGAPPLESAQTLNRAAAWMTLDMYEHQYISHTDSHGRNAGARVLDCGYHTGAAEIIAVGQLDAEGALAGFQGSTNHNTIMRDPRYQSVGIGHFSAPDGTAYWVVDLGLEPELVDTPTTLFEGWTHISAWPGPALEGAAVGAYLTDVVEPDTWVALAEYDAARDLWLQTLKDAPIATFNTLSQTRPEASYWIYVEADASLNP
jgi:hypothetical protein